MNFYKKDPHYFLKYFIVNAIVFSVLSAVLYNLKNLEYNHNWLYLCLIPLGVLFGLVMATVFHNTSHGNIKPKILNDLIGEFAGAYTLEGMRNFKVGHMLHHIHTDDDELDPHPPKGLTFLQFILTSRNRTIEILVSYYFKFHGKTAKSKANIVAQLVIYHIGFFAKITFWLYLLGLPLFLFFFIPSYLAYFFGFAHLNYISHQEDDSGEVVVKNHYKGAFYKVMNIITSGGYYHKNHHLYPRYYNPSKVPY